MLVAARYATNKRSSSNFMGTSFERVRFLLFLDDNCNFLRKYKLIASFTIALLRKCYTEGRLDVII